MILRTRTKVAVARILSRIILSIRAACGLGPRVRVRRQGLLWDLDLKEGIDLSIYVFGSFEPETGRALRRLAGPGSTVLDIGANSGAHTLPLAQQVGPEGRVIAFEPTDYACSKLFANLALNPAIASRVVVEQIMLVAAPGAPLKSHLYSSWPLENGPGLHQLHRGRLMTASKAGAETLDDYLSRTGVARVDLIKIDVDGHELPVLKGSLRTLRRFHPRIVMEMSPYSHDEERYSFEELIELLRRLGYRFRRPGSDRPIPLDAAELRRTIPAGSGINVIAEFQEKTSGPLL